MAKLTVTVTVFLFILSLVQARTPLDLPENGVNTQELRSDGQESVPKTTATGILLPSEKQDAKPKTETKPENTETIDFVPLTVINFRPINRHFPRHPSLTLRHRRPCRHHRMGRPARIHQREVSYGNDMLMSSGENKVVRQIPADGNGPRFPFGRDDDVARREGFKRPRYHHPLPSPPRG
ncbi:sarcoplasmic reticulum histidine-rich calcium-binding protein-like [Melia azedarach]|uniref:Sarcoplasmic reticulum histidine-rich calcium-binding protein-like n=1 Tax=Melia azedarach TaxID=155640 RepID=A0ACC1XKD2_MELAZ|nr:sarcoplasmic reticulum histidine-rich calcium-binding protein-like [Melia azedarach]